MEPDPESEARAFTAGLHERLVGLVTCDVFYSYGVLIAKGEAEFRPELLGSAAELMKAVPKTAQMVKAARTLDW